MITKDNIQKVLLELKFISNHGVYTRHFGSADEGFDLEYNFNVGEFIYPDGVQADRNTTQDEHQNESFVVFVCVAQLFERGYLPQHIKLEGRNYAGTDKGYCDILVSDNNGEPYLILNAKRLILIKRRISFVNIGRGLCVMATNCFVISILIVKPNIFVCMRRIVLNTERKGI